ncbi:MAG: hypothetical protein AAGF02_16015, partial [Actinomycetota bacterium]
MNLAELEDELRAVFDERAADVAGSRPAPPRSISDAGAISHTTEVVRAHRRRPLLAIAASVAAVALAATAVVALRPSTEIVPAGMPDPLFLLPGAEAPPVSGASISSSLDLAFADADLLVFLVDGQEDASVHVWSAPAAEAITFGEEDLVVPLANASLEARIGSPDITWSGVAGDIALLVRSDLSFAETRAALRHVELVDGRARLVADSPLELVAELDGFDEVRASTDVELEGGIFIRTEEVSGDRVALSEALSTSGTQTEIRGRDGWVYELAGFPPLVQWMETDRHSVTVQGAVPVEHLLSIATGLDVVTAEEWLDATDGVRNSDRRAGPVHLLPSDGSDVSLISAQPGDDVVMLGSVRRNVTFGRHRAGALSELVNVYVVDRDPSDGELVTIELADGPRTFRSIAPPSAGFTVLEADLDDGMLGVSSGLPPDELADLLGDVIVDDAGSARLAPGSDYTTIRASDEPTEL